MQQEYQNANWCQYREASEFLSFPVGCVRLQFLVKSIVHQDLQVHRHYLIRSLRSLQSIFGLLCIA